MTSEELWAEGLAMARPALRLSPIPSGKPVGYFGGPALPGDATPGRHLLSFDAALLPATVRAECEGGVATLHYEDEDADEPSRFAVVSATLDVEALPKAREEIETYAHLARKGNDGRRVVFRDLDRACVPLYAEPDPSLPQTSDLLQFGSPRVHAWLESLGWKPSDRYNRNLDTKSKAAAEYERRWFAHRYGPPESPQLIWSLPKHRTFATIGGWPELFIDDPLPEGDLVLTAFVDEEPRHHVLHVGGGLFRVIDEVT